MTATTSIATTRPDAAAATSNQNIDRVDSGPKVQLFGATTVIGPMLHASWTFSLLVNSSRAERSRGGVTTCPWCDPSRALDNYKSSFRNLVILGNGHPLGPRHDVLIALAPSMSITIDVEAFCSAAAAARQANNARAYHAALEIYTGELLPEDRYADWAARPPERLRAIQLQLLSELALVHEQQGEHAKAIGALRRL